MLFLGGVVFVVVVGGLLFKAVAFYAVYRFTMMRSYTISSRMLRGYLFQPYTWFLNRHSAEIGANVLGDVAKVTTKALLPAMKVLTYGVVVVGLVAAPRRWCARRSPSRRRGCSAAATSSSISWCASTCTASATSATSANKQRFQIAGEALGGIKDVKLLGLEEHFLARFRKPALQVAAPRRDEHHPRASCRTTCSRRWPSAACSPSCSTCSSPATARSPRSCRCSRSTPSPAIRIFPALQRIYNSLANMRFSKPTLDRLHADMKAAEANMRTLPPGPRTRRRCT